MLTKPYIYIFAYILAAPETVVPPKKFPSLWMAPTANMAGKGVQISCIPRQNKSHCRLIKMCSEGLGS